MNQETRNCQNCKNQFVIEPDDFTFYEHIKVLPPALCPDCRLQRRLAFRNERKLYKRICNLCNQPAITVYPPDAPFPVYCTKCWYSDKWDPLKYGIGYDLSRGFFEQYADLSRVVPHLGMPNPSNNYNSDYTSWVDDCKNCYLVFGSSKCEDVSYGELLYECKNAMDLTNCNNLELSYQCVSSKKCYKCIWCVNSVNCNECTFCFDCRGSNNCFMCTNLRNCSYCIQNIQYTPEEWRTRVQGIIDSNKEMIKALEEFKALMRERALHRFANMVKIANSSGNDLIETKNALNCFDSSKIEDCKYVSYGDVIKDCMDCYAIVENSELCYEHLSTRVTVQSAFMVGSWDSSIDVWYSQYLIGGEHCFGCMGLRKGSYCILNKQYSKEEYDRLVLEIITSMKKKGEFGEFFPISLSAFGYNETLANDYFPLSKEEALKKGYSWRDDVGGTFGQETIKPESLPDDIKYVSDLVTDGIFACAVCRKNFRITKNELGFYRMMQLPLPQKCPDCRYKERLILRNPRKLWKRHCQCAGEKSENGVYQNTTAHQHGVGKCPSEFETSYAPDRKEIVYCESCYNAEVV